MPDEIVQSTFDGDAGELIAALDDLEKHLVSVDGAARQMTGGLKSTQGGVGPMATLGSTILQTASAARIMVSALSALGPYIGGLPDSVSRVIAPLKTMFAHVGLVDSATKAFSGRLGVLGSVFTYLDARAVGASRGLATLGATGGLALSTTISAARGAVNAVGALGRGLLSIGGSLAPLAAVGGPFLLIAGAVAGIKRAFDLGGEFSDLSAQTGESIENLVVLKQAFENAGLGGEGVQATINRLQKSLGGLNEEGKNTKQALKELGLNADELGTQSAIEQVEALQKGFAGIEDAGARTSIAQALFGKSGGRMLSLLGDPEALETAKAQTGKLGSELQKNAAIFDKTSDSIGAMKLKFDQFFVGAASGLAPALSEIFDQLARTDWTDVGKRLGDVAKQFAVSAKFIGDTLSTLDNAINKTLDFFLGSQASGDRAVPTTAAERKAFKRQRDGEIKPHTSNFGGVVAIGNLGGAAGLLSEARKQTVWLQRIAEAQQRAGNGLDSMKNRPPLRLAL